MERQNYNWYCSLIKIKSSLCKNNCDCNCFRPGHWYHSYKTTVRKSVTCCGEKGATCLWTSNWLPLEAIVHCAEAQLAEVPVTGLLESHTEQKTRGKEPYVEPDFHTRFSSSEIHLPLLASFCCCSPGMWSCV